MISLKSYVKTVLFEMSRADKIDYRENYGHIGAVRDALYLHWVGNYRDILESQGLKESDWVEIEAMSFDYKKRLILDDSISKIKVCLNSIKSVEVSCNLVNPDRSYPIRCNKSIFGDLWGDIGFLIKPKVVTDGYGKNIGAPHYEVSQGSGGNSRFRKRVRPWKDEEFRRSHVPSAREKVRNSFPLDDKEAYRKGVDDFTYNESEFFVVAEEIVGIIYLDFGLSFFKEHFNDWYTDRWFDEHEYKKLYEEKRKFEKEYLSSICNKLGIPLYESDGEEIFDVPRLQSDL
jgi:hypothetical protein